MDAELFLDSLLKIVRTLEASSHLEESLFKEAEAVVPQLAKSLEDSRQPVSAKE